MISEDLPTPDSSDPSDAAGEPSETAGGPRAREAKRGTEAEDGEEQGGPGDDGAGTKDAATEEIDLSGGKTLSDYLEDEPSTKKRPKGDFRAIPNAVELVMPPPGGARPEGTEASPGPGGRAPSNEEDGAFGRMLEQSFEARSFEEGQTVTGTVVAIRPDVAFLDIGGKSEVPIDIDELKDDEGDIEVEIGDTIEAIFVTSDEGPKLSRRLARGVAAQAQISDAFRAGLPVEGRVLREIKGGYEVRVGGQRAFCPMSQIDSVRTVDGSVHVGKVLAFKILELKEGGKNLVVSRRALLQEEERAKAEETRKKIQVGAVLPGRVVSVREYGAFVDLGGTQGLLHVSEMGWARVSTPGEVVRPGDEITVKILKIDEQKGRISLGMKQLQTDPWTKVAETYAVGQIREGRIVRIQDFGAFVELEPGIEALAHASTFAPTGSQDGWKKTVAQGSTAAFEILSVDTDRKRIGVARLDEGHARAPRPDRGGAEAAAPDPGAPRPPAARPSAPRPSFPPGTRVKGKVERHEKFGVFVFLAPGRTGLLPAAESGEPRGADLRKALPVGSEVEVVVLESDPSGRRIRLSRKALMDAEEKDDARSYTERRVPTEAFGSMGEKLRAALASKKK